MTLATKVSSTGLETSLNLTITEFLDSSDAQPYCVYGRTGGPAAGSCDDIAAATTIAATTAFTPAVSNVALPNSSGSAAGRWSAGESHHFLVTVEAATNSSPPAGQTATIDLVWTGIQ
jgi:hypothetical protein